MIIGVDLDNTIINYEKSFYKVALKEKLINKSYEYKGRLKLKKYIEKKENKKKWMEIQGLVYGKFIKFAEINQGFCKFLRLSKLRNIKIYIISHKTEFPYFNNQISLRKKSLEWLKLQKIFSKKYNLNKKNLFFTNNRKEKIEKIKLLKCDIFIDDLKLILQNIYFPKNCKKIHFSQTKNLISTYHKSYLIN